MTTNPPDPDATEAVMHCGRSALAWEVLRRDPEYRAAWARIQVPSDSGIAFNGAFVERWGLHFP